MTKLIDTFNKYLENTNISPVDEQTPKYGVLMCSDSRVNFAHMIGEDTYNTVFSIENAGNKVHEMNLGSISYALEHTKVDLFIVLGHSTCGACAYAFDTKESPQEPLLDKELIELKKLAGECNSAEELEKKNVQQQVKTLRSIFPEHKEKIVGMYYHLKNKRVELIET